MIADQLFGLGEEWCEMVRRELRQDAEIAAELAVDDDAAGQAKRAQYVRQDVHWIFQSGVSVNSSGKPIILANRRIA
jgi:hypothetical protein